MGVIAISDFLVLVDSIAAQAKELDSVMGDGSGYGSPVTASDGAFANVERIRVLTDSEVIGELINGFREQFEKVTSNPNAYDRYFASCKALNIHVGGINAYLTAQGERVAPEFKASMEAVIAEKLDPANTFSPAIADMGDVSITGAGAGTFTDGDAVDIENYYATNIFLKKTTVAGGTPDSITLRVHLKDWDDNDVTKDVAVDGNDAIDTEYNVGTHPADKYTDVTDIEVISGGGSSVGENWQAFSKVERTIAL